MDTAAQQIAGQKRRRGQDVNRREKKHPYLTGNFAPIQSTLPLTPCKHVGMIPRELAGGQYVRNGSNPVSNADLGRDAHWFDGDGMLAGVYFTEKDDGSIQPEFVNSYILTDIYLNTLGSKWLQRPVLPSIATLVNPLASFIRITLVILRSILLVLLSHLPGSKQAVKKISVANTAVLYHDGRALATCESGPPMRFSLPGLETVGWYNGSRSENEPMGAEENTDKHYFGEGQGVLEFMREWTTAHPKVDPVTKELILFHSSFAPPFVQYSVIPSGDGRSLDNAEPRLKMLNAAVPGIGSAKMMHDFGVSAQHTVIMDLPLSLDPINMLRGKPVVAFDRDSPARFGVFPRQRPRDVTWFETEACCIFHTANTWDLPATDSVGMLACRLTSASLVFSAGNLTAPIQPRSKKNKHIDRQRKSMPFFSKYAAEKDGAVSEACSEEREPFLSAITPDETLIEPVTMADLHDEDQCRLYYYQFHLPTRSITHQWSLAAIPFEFPAVRPDREMSHARYVYGCSTTTSTFGSALGRAVKIDALVKADTTTLIDRGTAQPPRSVTGCVDSRTMDQILASTDPADPIKVFRLPRGWYAQETRFVPRGSAAEDDGYLVFYAFDEGSFVDADGDVKPDARSELWIVDARDMTTLVGRVLLPQRVPYGLHGTWFSSEDVRGQRAVAGVRTTAHVLGQREVGVWMSIRGVVEKMLA